MGVRDLEEEITEAKRELRMRYRVYPRMVADGRMTQQDMDRYLMLQHRIIVRLETLGTAQQLSLLEES